MLLIFKLILSCFIASIALANAQDLTCFEAGECRQSFHLGGDDSETQLTCLELCKANSDCNWFTFFPTLGYCEMFHNCTEINTEFCQDCISGESGCIVEPTCFVPGECQGNVDHIESADSQESCLALCQSREGCEWFTYHNTTSACILLLNCESISTECHECVSGENECQSGPKSVYLVGGSSPNEGNVFAINPLTGIDGPVCDDEWDYSDAVVVCRQLGFEDAEQIFAGSHFGAVPSIFSYDDLVCSGNEESIEDCPHSSSDNCAGTEGAGVRCIGSVSPTTTTTESSVNEVYLVGGSSSNEGNVFAIHPITGIDGPVCDDEWDYNDALVVCRQLGFDDVEEVFRQSQFGNVPNLFSYDDLVCNGEEESIQDCYHTTEENCEGTEGAGVRCRSSVSPTTTTTESSGHEVSLVGGQSDNEGNVIARNPTTGISGPVCDDGWSIESATVVCRQLGYNHAEEATIQSFFGEVSNDFSYDDVNCSGDEVSLDECQHSPAENCDITEGAGVICA